MAEHTVEAEQGGFMTTIDDGLIDVPPGLRNVVVTNTELGDVRGGAGFYHYFQYSAVELATVRSFEDVWFLMLEGRLPSSAEAEAFRARVAPLRVLPEELRPVLRSIAMAGERFNPLAGLRTALSLVASARGLRPLWDSDEPQRRADTLLLCAMTPTILAALHRIRSGEEPLEPRADLSASANWLYLITGAVPDPKHARAVEQYLICTVDHGFNASTFTARVIASTGADAAAAIAGAIGAFSGPLHGGAPDRALDGLDEIGSADRAGEWVREKVRANDRVMGFGHAVYRTEDPRSLLLRDIAVGLGGDLVDFAVAVEEKVVRTLAEVKPGRNLYTNVEYYAGVVMELCGIPRAMFTPTFAVSRVVGWSANILEQARNGKMIRPAARYVGTPPPQPVPTAD
jgi:citrate synthase